eukprot:CAMPEP_0172490008 /NCGR_PEP_ID=MMETSP1066-20121228/20321_1 /TAXON_ID=671091 /ORGANISM="Coscinodiscus wailesii, Strain CCMP2513" /LENGTH=41 /DNA_ID= /DNA_START= /DNA_END= /DNA_ORIENTATION=
MARASRTAKPTAQKTSSPPLSYANPPARNEKTDSKHSESAA